MRIRHFTVLAVAAVAAIFALANRNLAIAEEPAGDAWVELLPDGDFTKHFKTHGNWITKDGAVTLVPRDGEKDWTRYNDYLWLADGDFKDFEFQFDYKPEAHSNSGFYFHVGDVKEPVGSGIEVQIYDSGSKSADAKLNDHDSGGIIPGIPPTKNASKPTGEWNTFHITVKDDKLTVKLNGETVNEVDIASKDQLKNRPKTGSIGFQDHALPISFRNIKIKKL